MIPPPAGPPAAATAAPSPGAAARPVPKTIVTVKSSPYCNALEEHFNGALVPMLANDRVFASVDVQLGDMNDLWNHPDYQNRYLDIRNDLLKEVTVVQGSLRPISDEIYALKQASAASSDPEAAKEMAQAASQLKDAWLHQFQLANDLTNMTHDMMDFNIMKSSHPLGGFDPQEAYLPADEKNVKEYVHIDRQIDSINTSENQAADTATNAAVKHCGAQSP